MNNKQVGTKVVSGISWTFAERILAQGVSFLVSIVLARILAPDAYGVIAIVLVFINIANVFVSNGLGEALVQRDEIDETEYSTVFWMSFVLSIVLYIFIFFLSPIIANYYNIDVLTPALRVLGLKLIFSSLNTVQHAYISKKMQFRRFFFATLGGTLTSAVVGIVMAVLGFGIWALIAQYLINTVMDTIILQFSIEWRPTFVFSMPACKQLFSYGWKLTASALIIATYNELRSMIIGKVYSTEELAYYNRGNHFPSVLINNLNAAIGKVFFPMMVALNKDISELKKFTRKTLQMSSYLIFPLLTWMIVCAKPIIIIILTEKWLPSVPYMQILCLFWITQPMQTTNWQVLKAVGRSDLCMKLEILKKAVGIVLIILTMKISVIALAWSAVAFAFFSTIVNMWPIPKLINYSFFEQFKDILPIIVCCVTSGLLSWTFSYFVSNMYILLITQSIVGLLSYYLFSKMLCRDLLSHVRSLLHSIINRK